ncbi:hypothetical protein Tco_1013236 [Tanacetum coccineum]
MKSVFTQMEIEVAKCSVDKKYFEIEKKELSLDNDRLLEHIICQDVMNIVMHANDQTDNVLPTNNNSLEHDNSAFELLKHENDLVSWMNIMSLVLKAKLAKKNDVIEKAVYNELSKRCFRLENRCISLEIKLQQSKESFQNNRPSHNHDAPEFKEFCIINELQAQLKANNVSIEKLKEYIANIKGKNVVESLQNVHNSNVVTSKVYKLDLPPLSPCIKNNMVAHVDYLKHTQENVDIIREIVEHARDLRPLDSDLASACKFVTRIQELLVYVSATCPSSKHVSDKLVAVTPMNNTRKVSKKKEMWKPTGKVYTNVGYSWKPTGRTFTIVENTCPLTRNISTNVVPPRKSISATPAKQTQPSRTNHTLIHGLGLLQAYDWAVLSVQQLR